MRPSRRHSLSAAHDRFEPGGLSRARRAPPDRPRPGRRQGGGMTDDALKQRILLAMLPDVPFEGWSRAALRRAAAKLGHDEAETNSLFPGGARDVVACFSAWADRETEKALARKKLETLKVRERIALGVKTRLEILAPTVEAVRSLLAFLALSVNLPHNA